MIDTVVTCLKRGSG